VKGALPEEATEEDGTVLLTGKSGGAEAGKPKVVSG